MLGVVSSGWSLLLTLLIAMITVLLCLRMLAQTLGRKIVLHNRKVEAHRERIAEAAARVARTTN